MHRNACTRPFAPVAGLVEERIFNLAHRRQQIVNRISRVQLRRASWCLWPEQIVEEIAATGRWRVEQFHRVWRTVS